MSYRIVGDNLTPEQISRLQLYAEEPYNQQTQYPPHEITMGHIGSISKPQGGPYYTYTVDVPGLEYLDNAIPGGPCGKIARMWLDYYESSFEAQRQMIICIWRMPNEVFAVMADEELHEWYMEAEAF